MSFVLNKILCRTPVYKTKMDLLAKAGETIWNSTSVSVPHSLADELHPSSVFPSTCRKPLCVCVGGGVSNSFKTKKILSLNNSYSRNLALSAGITLKKKLPLPYEALPIGVNISLLFLCFFRWNFPHLFGSCVTFSGLSSSYSVSSFKFQFIIIILNRKHRKRWCSQQICVVSSILKSNEFCSCHYLVTSSFLLLMRAPDFEAFVIVQLDKEKYPPHWGCVGVPLQATIFILVVQFGDHLSDRNGALFCFFTHCRNRFVILRFQFSLK